METFTLDAAQRLNQINLKKQKEELALSIRKNNEEKIKLENLKKQANCIKKQIERDEIFSAKERGQVLKYYYELSVIIEKQQDILKETETIVKQNQDQYAKLKKEENIYEIKRYEYQKQIDHLKAKKEEEESLATYINNQIY